MTGLLFLFGAFLALGLFFIAASILRLPTIGAAKAMLGTVKQERKAAKSLETRLMTAAVRLSKWIHMDETDEQHPKGQRSEPVTGGVSGVCHCKIRRCTERSHSVPVFAAAFVTGRSHSCGAALF